MFEIRRLESFSTGDLSAINDLLKQLRASDEELSRAQLETLLDQDSVSLLVARTTLSPHVIVGMLTVALIQIPTGKKAWIEDVVVHHGHRRQGIASSLMKTAIHHAAENGCRIAELTSRPERKVANRMYCRMGFEYRDTNVYRLLITPDED